MSIEAILERIAVALETVAANAGQTTAENGDQKEVRTRRKKADQAPVADSEPTPAVTPEAPAAATQAPAPAEATASPDKVTAPELAALQARASTLSQKLGKETVVALIKKYNPEGKNLSSMSDEGRAGMWSELDAIEIGATAAEFA